MRPTRGLHPRTHRDDLQGHPSPPGLPDGGAEQLAASPPPAHGGQASPPSARLTGDPTGAQAAEAEPGPGRPGSQPRGQEVPDGRRVCTCPSPRPTARPDFWAGPTWATAPAAPESEDPWGPAPAGNTPGLTPIAGPLPRPTRPTNAPAPTQPARVPPARRAHLSGLRSAGFAGPSASSAARCWPSALRLRPRLHLAGGGGLWARGRVKAGEPGRDSRRPHPRLAPPPGLTWRRGRGGSGTTGGFAGCRPWRGDDDRSVLSRGADRRRAPPPTAFIRPARPAPPRAVPPAGETIGPRGEPARTRAAQAAGPGRREPPDRRSDAAGCGRGDAAGPEERAPEQVPPRAGARALGADWTRLRGRGRGAGGRFGRAARAGNQGPALPLVPAWAGPVPIGRAPAAVSALAGTEPGSGGCGAQPVLSRRRSGLRKLRSHDRRPRGPPPGSLLPREPRPHPRGARRVRRPPEEKQPFGTRKPESTSCLTFYLLILKRAGERSLHLFPLLGTLPATWGVGCGSDPLAGRPGLLRFSAACAPLCQRRCGPSSNMELSPLSLGAGHPAGQVKAQDGGLDLQGPGR